jgi:uncharacterized protein (TIGR03435 family)
MVSEDTTRAMLRNLLADRFGLVLRSEKRTLPIYALVLVSKDRALGPQLVQSHVDCETRIAEKRPTARAGSPSGVAPGDKRPPCGMLVSRRFLTAGTVSIQRLAVALQSLVQRPVVDRTGLEGQFDIDLNWAKDDAAGPPDGEPQASALREQLGLKLDPGRAPFDVMVVQSVKRPAVD